MRILFVTWGYPPGSAGGAERQAQRQAEELVRRGHSVVVVCPMEPGFPARSHLNGVTVRRLWHIRARPFKRISYLLALLASCLAQLDDFDIVHVHLANLQADVAAMAARIRRKPLWVKVACGGAAGEVARFASVSRVTRWYGLRSAARVQAISDEIATELREVVGVDARRIVRIPNGIFADGGSSVIGRQVAALRTELALPVNGVCFLFLGRLAAYKGLDVLAQAWARSPRVDERYLAVVGPQAVDKPFDASVLVGPDVYMPGNTDRPQDYLQACDVFVYPSFSDGMSNAVLEAMVAGRPIIATDANANPELLDNGGAGLLVPPGDVAALREAMDLMAASPALRATLGEAAREASRRYDIAAVVDAIEREYHVVIADHTNRQRLSGQMRAPTSDGA